MNLKNDLEKIEDIVIYFDSDLTNYSTFRLKAKGDLIIVKTLAGLSQLVKILKSHNRSYRLIGWGANQVLMNQEKDLLIKLELNFDPTIFKDVQPSYHLPASTGLNLLTSHALKFNLSGWEVFTGVPASLGGAIAMNAGTALGEIGKLVKSVRIMNSDGLVRDEIMTEKSFSYRTNNFLTSGDIIISAEVGHNGVDSQISQKIKDYVDYRKSSQPLASRNCGCVFKNYDKEYKAGKYIDLTGLKGLSVGALSVSSVHANFMENKGGANYEQFIELTRLINQQIHLHWGIEFELEVKAV